MKGLRLYVLVISIAALLAVAALSLFAGAWTQKEVIAATFFASFGMLAQVLGYQRSKGRSGTIAFLPFLSIAAVSPNSAAIASVFIAMLFGEIIARREFLKALFNISQQVLAVATAQLVYVALGGTSLLFRPVHFPAFIALFGTYMVMNKAVVAYVLALANKTAFQRELVRGFKGTLLNDLLALPLVVVFALAYSTFGPIWTGVLALPMLGVRQLYKSVFELERINEELLQLMVAAIEARDPYTSGHSQRVARYSRVIARVVGLSARQVEEIGTAALLHDVGKIHEEFAPILRQPRKLTAAEFEVMKTHSAKGAVLVSKVSQFKNIVPAVRGHHERWSGKGYPDSLAGDDIPLGARIITIADTIDAMTTVRPYRPPRDLDDVRAELTCVSGIQFDPRICAQLLKDEHWRELSLEVEIAAREFPADTAAAEPVSGEIPRHSTQTRVP
ncbi:MAG: HD-GYP domain-containing protein [Gemmatimonadetes bacterium]|nr:HD-GYP domain-containing protein [Gemmatimonadota bacterium]